MTELEALLPRHELSALPAGVHPELRGRHREGQAMGTPVTITSLTGSSHRPGPAPWLSLLGQASMSSPGPS